MSDATGRPLMGGPVARFIAGMARASKVAGARQDEPALARRPRFAAEEDIVDLPRLRLKLQLKNALRREDITLAIASQRSKAEDRATVCYLKKTPPKNYKNWYCQKVACSACGRTVTKHNFRRHLKLSHGLIKKCHARRIPMASTTVSLSVDVMTAEDVD